jgi:isopenicillin N synthase-like dioxygenase
VTAVPVIDVGGLTTDTVPDDVAAQIDRACRDVGFFSVVGHGVDLTLAPRLDALAREFFARPEEEKDAVAMVHGGTAWRGWFPLRGELTSGTPDHKEGYYFGRELPATDPRVRARIPLHGPNVWPGVPTELRPTLLAYLDALEDLGRRLTAAISVALGFDAHTLPDRWFRDPVILLRLFRYPPPTVAGARGVGEHTDYGFLTLLWQDAAGGLEVRSGDSWVEVPPAPDAFVCNLGDMLDRVTEGRYRSTPHRVRSPLDGDRISIPFFFDPDWDAEMSALTLAGPRPADDADRRWDGTSVHDVAGTYGDYLMGKVAKVFPTLRDAVIDDGSDVTGA